MVTIEITYHMDEHLCPSEELSAGINLLNKDVLCCQLPYTGEWLYNASPGHATKWVVEYMNGYHGSLLAPKQISHWTHIHGKEAKFVQSYNISGELVCIERADFVL